MNYRLGSPHLQLAASPAAYTCPMSSGWPGGQDLPDPDPAGARAGRPAAGRNGPGRHGPGRPGAGTADRGRGTKALVAAGMLIVLIVFVIRNSGRVRLDFIVTSGHPRLIWLIVGCVLLGGAVGYFLGRPAGRRLHRPSGARKADPPA